MPIRPWQAPVNPPPRALLAGRSARICCPSAHPGPTTNPCSQPDPPSPHAPHHDASTGAALAAATSGAPSGSPSARSTCATRLAGRALPQVDRRRIVALEVSWPKTGETQTFEDVKPDRTARITEGSDAVVELKLLPVAIGGGK